MNTKKTSHIISIEERSSDSRGSIKSVMDGSFSNVSIITCEPKTIRSNHLHFTDTHHMYVLKGKIEYFYINPEGAMVHFEVVEGQTVFTPSDEFHATYFPVKTTLIVASKNPRDQETYESDTIRKEIISIESVQELL